MPKVEPKDGENVCSCGRILYATETDKCYLCSKGLLFPVPKKVIGSDEKTNKTKAKFVTEIEVIDPDTKNPIKVAIYKEEHGGMIGIDSSYLENEVGEVISPFGNGELELEGD
jgi:hypothetical protein